MFKLSKYASVKTQETYVNGLVLHESLERTIKLSDELLDNISVMIDWKEL